MTDLTEDPADAQRAAEWEQLYTALLAALAPLGKNDHLGNGDYWLLDDDYGNCEQALYIKLHWWSGRVFRTVQDVLRSGGFHEWRVYIGPTDATPGDTLVWRWRDNSGVEQSARLTEHLPGLLVFAESWCIYEPECDDFPYRAIVPEDFVEACLPELHEMGLRPEVPRMTDDLGRDRDFYVDQFKSLTSAMELDIPEAEWTTVRTGADAAALIRRYGDAAVGG
jgi:hypothetical protein